MSERILPCGICRTTEAIGDSIPVGVLVYYHNHGDPGPGVYLPLSWKYNRAVFDRKGTTVPRDEYAETLVPLLPEGLYRVIEPFHCCDRRCKHFEEDQLVQLGYNGSAQPILFVPELVGGAFAVPTRGTLVDDDRLVRLQQLKVRVGQAPKDPTPQ